MARNMQREFPVAPLVGVGAVVVEEGRVLLVRRGSEPLKGQWSLPGGLLELGESLAGGVVREVREETGLDVEPVELIELLDRIQREGERVRYHYVIADYLCRVTGGHLQAASDADAVRWVERAEWNSHQRAAAGPGHGAGDRDGLAEGASASAEREVRKDEDDEKGRSGLLARFGQLALIAGNRVLAAAGELLQRRHVSARGFDRGRKPVGDRSRATACTT